MTFLAPGVLAMGAVALAALAVLHWMARRRPRAVVLPTARFVPERPTRLLSRTVALTDPWLLLLRALAVAALVLAFAQPVLARRRERVARVVLVDRSRDVADVGELRDSVRSVADAGTTVIVFDTAAARLTTAPDSIRLSGAGGSLSAAFAAALRAGAAVAATADSVELVVVSPLAGRETDAATGSIAAGWPGRVRRVPVALRGADTTSRTIEVRAANGDAVAAAASLGVRSAATVRVVRDALGAADSAWLAAAAGRVLVGWPAAGLDAGGARRPSAVVAGRATVVAPFGGARAPALGAVIARWADGSPAATERAVGGGCARDVAIPVDQRSDVALRPAFRALVAALVAPCGEAGAGVALAGEASALPPASGPLAAGRALAPREGGSSPLAPLLLAVGVALLLVEWLARRRVASVAGVRAAGARVA